MNEDILISVVIPLYKTNDKDFEYVTQAINSIANQPYKNTEILLINDGSPQNVDDFANELCEKFPNLKYISKSNEGVGATRNFGIKAAKGDYIAFLDHDDIWANGFLDEKIVEAIKNGGDMIAFSYYNCSADFKRGNIIRVKPKVVENGGANAVKSLWNHHSSIIYKRQTLLDNDIGYAKSRRNEDEIFRHKCLYVSKKVTFIDKPIFLYRNNVNSETHKRISIEDLYGALLKSWVDLLEWHLKNHAEDEDIINHTRWMICVYAIEGIEALYQTERPLEEMERVAKEYLCKDYLDKYRYLACDNHKYEMDEYCEHYEEFIKNNKAIGKRKRRISAISRLKVLRPIYERKKYGTVLDESLYRQ